MKNSVGTETERGILSISCLSLISLPLLPDPVLSSNLLPSFPLNQVSNLFNQEGLEVWFVIAGDVEIQKYLLGFIRKTSTAGFHLYWLFALITVTLQSCQQDPYRKRGSFPVPLHSTEVLGKTAGSECWEDGNFMNLSSFRQEKDTSRLGIIQKSFQLRLFSSLLLTNMPLTRALTAKAIYLLLPWDFCCLTFSWLLLGVTYLVIA